MTSERSPAPRVILRVLRTLGFTVTVCALWALSARAAPGSLTTWQPYDIGTLLSGEVSGALSSISCPSKSLCVLGRVGFPGDAMGALSAGVEISTNPTDGPGAWQGVRLIQGTNSTTGGTTSLVIDCPTTSLCVGAGQGPTLLTTSNPTGGAGAWSSTALPTSAQNFDAVSCPSARFCVAAGGGTDSTLPYPYGEIAYSSDPADGSSWQFAAVDPDLSNTDEARAITGISCPSAQLCVGIDDYGDVLTSTNPTDPSTWNAAQLAPHATLTGVSCPTVSLCVVVDTSGDAFVSGNPSGGSGAWTKGSMRGQHTTTLGVTCPSPAMCVAIGLGPDGYNSPDSGFEWNYHVALSTTPTQPGSWQSVLTASARETVTISQVSCSTTMFCAALGLLAGSPGPDVIWVPTMGASTSPSPRCQVPDVKGKTVAAAKQAIKRAHCALGRITKPKRPQGHEKYVLVVARQSPTRATARPPQSRVNLTLSYKPPRRAKRN